MMKVQRLYRAFFFVLLSVGAAFGQAEIEPNNSLAQADASGIVVSSTTVISGAISAVADVDYFRVDVTTAGVVRFETFTNAAANDCISATMTLRLRDAAGVQILADSGSGINSCGAISIYLNPGTYYIQNEETGNNATVSLYSMRVVFHANAGNEIEANNTIATANSLSAAPLYVFGDHSVNTDSDFYAITVANGQSIRAEIVEGDRAVETCESLNLDSRLTLYDSIGTQLTDDDDDGRGFCSLIDGSGTTPLDVAANNLPAGTYYLQVRASTFAQTGTGGQFVYRLVVNLVNPPPSAASVSVGGRVLTEDGRGVTNTRVVLTDSAGETRTVRTSSFGYYRFENVEVGQTYIFGIASKRYEFQPRTVLVADELSDLDLVVRSNE